jgi:hypothetical protein
MLTPYRHPLERAREARKRRASYSNQPQVVSQPGAQIRRVTLQTQFALLLWFARAAGKECNLSDTANPHALGAEVDCQLGLSRVGPGVELYEVQRDAGAV